MRVVSRVVALALVALAVSSPAVARDWNLRGGMGTVNFTGGSSLRDGSSVFVGAETPVSPWLHVGAEASSREFMLGSLVSIPEVRAFADRSYDVSLALTLRVQPPVRRGFVPFALAEAGVGRTQWGDVHYEDLGFGWPSSVTQGAARWGVRSAAGVGVRGALARPLPDFEVSARWSLLSGDHQVTMLEPRFALAW